MWWRPGKHAFLGVGLGLFLALSGQAQELAQEVKLTISCFPPAQVYLDTPSGLSLLGYTVGELSVKPPLMRDPNGKVIQYARGELVLKAPNHQDLRLLVTAQDWASGRLPDQRLLPNSAVVAARDYLTVYPGFTLGGLALLVWGLVMAFRWKMAARSTAAEVMVLSSQLDASGDPLVGKKLGGYRVEARVGQGGMGSVYRVRDDVGTYAAKVIYFESLDSQSVDRFRREFKLLSQLRHPAFPVCFDYQERDGMAYCIMELVQGETLRQAMRATGLPWSTVLPWLHAILDGLECAHQQGIVHRDLKPENIMVVNGEGEVKILDFGIARQAQVTAITMTGQAFGTPQYMAPEQIYGSSTTVDARTDLYSLGIILFELLSGQPPFQADDVQELLTMQFSQPPPPLASSLGLPPGVSAMVEVLLAKNPANRYPSVDRVKAALDGLVQLSPSDSSPSTIEVTRRGTTPIDF